MERRRHDDRRCPAVQPDRGWTWHSAPDIAHAALNERIRDFEMTQASTSADARIDELETRLSLQDQSILELSNEVYQQQKQIAQLESTVRRLAARLQSIELAQPPGDVPNEVPPHY